MQSIYEKIVRINMKWVCQTFIEAILIHSPIHVEVLPGHQGELCLRMLIRTIIRVIAWMRKHKRNNAAVKVKYLHCISH